MNLTNPKKKKLFLVMGARPNFMKVAPLYRYYLNHSELKEQCRLELVHTGQHSDPDMDTKILNDLEITSIDHHLGAVGGGSHAEQTAKIMIGFERLCIQERPDWVWVVGDITSTLACALTAKKLNIKLGHIEAGLRSFNRSMPEEINRLAVDAISDVFFTPSEDAEERLKIEGVLSDRIISAGNLMIDSLFYHASQWGIKAPKNSGLLPSKHCVLTVHRPQNVDSEKSLAALVAIVEEVAKSTRVIFPCHPRTMVALEKYQLFDRLQKTGIQIEAPADYRRMLQLYGGASFVMTDSGGVQEETTALGIPCLTLREDTERPLTVSCGTSVLVGLSSPRIQHEIELIKKGEFKNGSVPKLWDGKAAERIWHGFLKILQSQQNVQEVA